MTQILIALYDVDGTVEEVKVINDLIADELNRCPTCSKVKERTEHLPFHCNDCFVRRDERWIRSLERRAHSAVFPPSDRVLQ